MVAPGTVRLFGLTCLFSLPMTAALTMLQPANAQNQRLALPENTSQIQPDSTDPNNLRSFTKENDSGLLSFQGGKALIAEANNAINAQKYTLAISKLQEARQVFNQLSNFYQQLYSSFSGIDPKVADSHQKKALESAQMRDEATYQLALTHRAQNQPELAVPLLIQVIKSQNPTRDLGKKAYDQLLELGFVDNPATGADNLRPLNQDSSVLSLPGGKRLLTEANNALNAQNYTLAIKKGQDARQVFNQLSNFYQQLYSSWSGIDNRVADAHQKRALESAQLRDEATYQLALTHRAQNQPELAVPLLIQIIKSQNPTRDLGTKAYQQLLELGFVDVSFPSAPSTPPAASNTPKR